MRISDWSSDVCSSDLLVPKKIDNLLVASKASGYSSLAAGSARIVPTGMSTAEAAGVASVLSYKNEVNFREMSKNKKLVNKLQDELIAKEIGRASCRERVCQYV